MTAPHASTRNVPGVRHGTAYNLFILTLTLFSLVIMVLLLLPLNEETARLVVFYDAAICLIFLGDFLWNLARAPVRRDYLVRERGWLDLVGSIPTLGLFQLTALFRLARLSRLYRSRRLLRRENRQGIIRDVVQNRAEYAGFITILLAGGVLVFASLLVLSAESHAAEGNISSGWDAFWWSFVTMTTVGYGDRYPVTVVGRITAMFVMAMGIGIIGALASILASVLLGGNDSSDAPPPEDGLAARIEALREEVAALTTAVERLALAGLATDSPTDQSASDP